MYRINTIPGEAAKAKGHASYPEDFPHLRPGESFTAWKAGEDWEIETTLDGAALRERLEEFERTGGSDMNKGYEKLAAAVTKDCEEEGGTLHPEGCCKCGGKCDHHYCDKFKWVIDRAKAYGEATGLNWEDILDSWEQDRNYWYMNYYQDCNQPEIKGGKVRVFDTLEDFRAAIGEMKFRCPSCGKVTADPYECKACGWKVYGLLGDLGKGVFVYVKDKLKGDNIFMPISWEEGKA